MHASFVHLRLHSAYSLAESTLRIKQLAALVSADQQPAAAITDTNNMFGALEFSQAMLESGVQPIIGTQMLLRDDAGMGEIVLLAMNEAGYSNLCKLQSKALLEAEATIDASASIEDLATFAEGLLLLSGGASAGFIGAVAAEDRLPLAKSRLQTLHEIFPTSLYVEIQRHGMVEEARSEEDDGAAPTTIDDEAISANLATLQKLEVTVAGERVANIETLRKAANQAVVVVAGPSSVVDDALRDALIEQKTLAAAEVLVVPVRTSAEDAVEAAMGRRSDSYGFVAPPVDADKWKAYAAAECAVAAGQGASTASEDGIVIAVRADGTVARRGLGKPVWKMVAAELSPPEKGEASV